MRSNGTANCLTLDRFPSAVAFPFFFLVGVGVLFIFCCFFLKKIFYSSRPTRRSTRFLFHYLRNSDFKPHSGFRFVSCTSPTIRRRPTRWINRTLLADVVMVTSEPENGGLFKSERETCRRRRRRRRRRGRQQINRHGCRSARHEPSGRRLGHAFSRFSQARRKLPSRYSLTT